MNRFLSLDAQIRMGISWILGLCWLGLSLNVQALSLAGIEVQSHKGEPLRAEISVASATADEWGQLVVKVAPAERFAQLGLVFSPEIGQVQVELFETSDGSKRIRLLSQQAFSDPFVDLLIEAQTASGKWVKAFTLMLQPTPLKVETPIQLPLSAGPLSQAVQAIQAPAEHIVQNGESASQIIQKWLTEDMSMQQMLVALLKNQPDAFIQGNVNLLRAGAVLKAPSQTAVRAIDVEEARKFLIAQQKEFIVFSQAAAQNTPSVKGQAPNRQMVGKVGQEEAVQVPAQTGLDQLKLSQAKIEKQNAETKLAAQRALSDAQKQLDMLQSNVNKLVQLHAAAPISLGQAGPAPALNSSSADIGLLNLNKLLNAPHQNSYLWAALTLLGVLAVWAGLRIQSRKSLNTLNTLNTLPPTPDVGKSNVHATLTAKLALPADIASLNLNLDSTPAPPKTPGDAKLPASTETPQ
jgi:pilus assembly protein FimV